jgi:protein MpaA
MVPRLGGAIALLLVVPLSLPTAGAGAVRSDPGGRRIVTLGRSVDGRPITAVETGDLDAGRRALIVGCIHGNETAGIAIADHLTREAPPVELDLWIIPDLNPDGVAAGLRGNADGVDLNRNFPWRWRPLTGSYDSGPHALSEPESRIAYRLVKRLEPNVSIWFHQHLDVVDESGGMIAVERRFAKLTGMRLARLTREPGSAVGWTDRQDRAGTAFVVELPAGQLTPTSVSRYARAVLAVAAPSGSHAKAG